MKKHLRLIVAFLAICLAFSLTACKQSSSNKTLTVGTNPEFPPFEFINSEGEPDGFDIAIIKAIGKEMGYDVTIKSMEFKSLLASINSGGIDCAIAGMTITDERKKSVDFSNSYYTATQYIVVPIDSSISTINELNGKKIAVQEGTTGDIMATPDDDNDIITDTSTQVKRFKKGTDAILELKNGGVDAVIIDANPAQEFVKANSASLKYVVDNSSTEEYAIAVTKGNTELVDKLNQGLQKLYDNGTFDKLVEQYINDSESSAYVSESTNPFVRFAEKLNYVFIETNGYKLLLNGLKTTIFISLTAALLGIFLGFIIALMKLTENKKGKKTILSRIANIYIDIIRGTPSMVQLLIMYMIIFHNKFGVAAAILTFGINSAAYVAEIIRAGILAVDNGQMEGGRSLGFSYGQTMRYIIIPQAVKNILPALGNEFITLIKETAIVGYVAIQDLTKASDFIISRTYETFLPLIAIAIIYYLLIKILSKLLSMFERRLRKSDIR